MRDSTEKIPKENPQPHHYEACALPLCRNHCPRWKTLEIIDSWNLEPVSFNHRYQWASSPSKASRRISRLSTWKWWHPWQWSCPESLGTSGERPTCWGRGLRRPRTGGRTTPARIESSGDTWTLALERKRKSGSHFDWRVLAQTQNYWFRMYEV